LIERQGTWDELDTHVYIKDRNGVTWKIAERQGDRFGIVNRAGNRAVLEPKPAKHPVTIVTPTEIEAWETLRDTLGAEVLGQREDPASQWVVARFQPNSKAFAPPHMTLFHGTYVGDIKTAVDMAEAHDHSHAHPDRGYVPHRHNP
jgi:hypothetical protein